MISIPSSQGLKNPKPELYISFNSVCINIVVVYSDCYYANLVTDRTTQIADDAYSCPWYTYTTCMKKSIALLIQQSQKSFYYTGLGLMHCTLATFSMVMHVSKMAGPSKSLKCYQISSWNLLHGFILSFLFTDLEFGGVIFFAAEKSIDNHIDVLPTRSTASNIFVRNKK